MSEYNGLLFLGFCSSAPMRVLWPDWFYYRVIAPRVPVGSRDEALYAPCGTRKIEAALLGYGFGEDEVLVTTPENLRSVVGPETRIIGITANDPLGMGPATTTFCGIIKRKSYLASEFEALVTDPWLRRWGAKVIVGGPGAWQFEKRPDLRRKWKIDHVVIGEGEHVVPPLFERIIRGERAPEIIYGNVVENIPSIKRATICGIIEVARGCGRGCRFCLPTLQRLRCLPIDQVLEEVGINVREGRTGIVLHAEDILRYNANSWQVNPKAVEELFHRVKTFPGVERVGISHFSLASVASAPEVVRHVSEILELGTEEQPWIAGQTGIETGSPRLARIHMINKSKPFPPEKWPEVIEQAYGILSDNLWIPASTLIIGLPGETDDDIARSIELVDDLKRYPGLIVPLFLVPQGGMQGGKPFRIEDANECVYQLLYACWEYNIRWLLHLTDLYVLRSRRTSLIAKMLFGSFIISLRTILAPKMEKEIQTWLVRDREGLIS
ncbi:MAG: B12-binding domain-containing radical SAM protein [Candidatus Bathyarchaeia archaeon]